MLRTRRRVLAAAMLLPLLLIAVSGNAYAAMLCASMGIVQSSCCCHGEDEASAAVEAESHASLEAEPCCTVVQVELTRADSVPPRDRESGDGVAWLAPTLILTSLDLGLDAATALRTEPSRWWQPRPQRGRSLVLAKRSLLL